MVLRAEGIGTGTRGGCGRPLRGGGGGSCAGDELGPGVRRPHPPSLGSRRPSVYVHRVNETGRSAHLLTEPWLQRIMDASRAPSCYAHPHYGEPPELHAARAIASALTYDDRELRANGLTPALPSESVYANAPPVRLREGALSPRATPSSPPAKPQLTPLDDGIELERETKLRAEREPEINWRGDWQPDATYRRNDAVVRAVGGQLEKGAWRADCAPDATLRGIIPMEGTEWTRLLPPGRRPPRAGEGWPPRAGEGPPITGEPTGHEKLWMETPENPADIVYHGRPPWADLSVFTIATAIVASIAFALALVALMYG